MEWEQTNIYGDRVPGRAQIETQATVNRLLGRQRTRPLRRADVRPWHAPGLAVAQLTAAHHRLHLRGRQNRYSVGVCRNPVCVIGRTAANVLLWWRHVWD